MESSNRFISKFAALLLFSTVLCPYSFSSGCTYNSGPEQDENYNQRLLGLVESRKNSNKPEDLRLIQQTASVLHSDSEIQASIQERLNDLRTPGKRSPIEMEILAYGISRDEYDRCFKKSKLLREWIYGNYKSEEALEEEFFENQAKAATVIIEGLTSTPEKAPKDLGSCAGEAKLDAFLMKLVTRKSVSWWQYGETLPLLESEDLLLVESILQGDSLQLQFGVHLSKNPPARVFPILRADSAGNDGTESSELLRKAERCYAKAQLVSYLDSTGISFFRWRPRDYAQKQMSESRSQILWMKKHF